MAAADEKLAMIQGQVTAKVHWEAPEVEVLEWLRDKHGIEGEQASGMFSIAQRARVLAIRKRALLGLALGVPILAITGSYLGVEFFTDTDLPKSGVVTGFFSIALAWSGKCLIRLLSGKTDVPIDS